MSQKIDGNFPAAQAALRAVGPSARPGVSSDAPARPVEAADSLKLTGEATSLQALERELSTAPAIDAQRVAQVRESLQNGSYRINPDAIASRMLELDQQLQG
ncbi:flagellar biosynthesis anti-sigma factor FlgM [Stenotrophomonas sp. C3(2023)]|jgi:negative regulator of flagellin synthesis FlgM|uniref:flagellar biosynthesis anti-sigma factor FlgM n=1 Tax=Stenotrophomonas sp. C3(2023) TaxID=3080277 RepID=UPI00293CAF40|nr:flagellar biosynthesis anti-sigma factor FlgM [Stenotrophomonas sp. C3(2023)]MDV3468758.1 flagellar biosynthesis anti-sigma factor FlgM [Stenotrophomonas sp. C3(2023)]